PGGFELVQTREDLGRIPREPRKIQRLRDREQRAPADLVHRLEAGAGERQDLVRPNSGEGTVRVGEDRGEGVRAHAAPAPRDLAQAGPQARPAPWQEADTPPGE